MQKFVELMCGWISSSTKFYSIPTFILYTSEIVTSSPIYLSVALSVSLSNYTSSFVFCMRQTCNTSWQSAASPFAFRCFTPLDPSFAYSCWPCETAINQSFDISTENEKCDEMKLKKDDRRVDCSHCHWPIAMPLFWLRCIRKPVVNERKLTDRETLSGPMAEFSLFLFQYFDCLQLTYLPHHQNHRVWEMGHTWLQLICLFVWSLLCSSIKIIDNGLAPPEIVHTPSISTKREDQLCL